MRANRGKDTGPEMAIRRALHARGWRYRVNLRLNLAGTSPRPDIVFPRRQVAVFIDGCFWHGCPTHGTWPTGLIAEVKQRHTWTDSMTKILTEVGRRYDVDNTSKWFPQDGAGAARQRDEHRATLARHGITFEVDRSNGGSRARKTTFVSDGPPPVRYVEPPEPDRMTLGEIAAKWAAGETPAQG